MARTTPGNYVPLDVNYPHDAAIRRAGPSAELLFVRGMAYAKRTRTNGMLPDYDLPVIAVGLKAVAKSVAALVRENLWVEAEGGWRIRSWEKWNTVHDGFSASGKRGNHLRWHVERGVTESGCEWCGESPGESGGDSPPISPPDRPTRSEGDIAREGKGREVKPSSDADAPTRQDVEHLCALMADLVEANGARRPSVTSKWRDAARLLIDRDGIDLADAERVMRWALADSFWRTNVLSLPKFRDKFDQLRLKADQPQRQAGPNGRVLPFASSPRTEWMDRA